MSEPKKIFTKSYHLWYNITIKGNERSPLNKTNLKQKEKSTMETTALIATATTHESKVNLFRALTNASPFSEAVNKTLSVVQIIDQPAVNDQGEPVNRYFFLCEDGSAYMSMALGVDSCVKAVRSIWGSDFAEPLQIVPCQVKTKNGHTYKFTVL